MVNPAIRLRVTQGKGEKAPTPKRTIPCMQTAWPHMLFPRLAATVPLVFPFDQRGLRYRYFARNAVWDAAQLLGLAGKKVLMPAYHHGVELETLLAAGVRPVFYRVDGEMRCDFADPGMTRRAQVRFSTPQVAWVGAQKPGISRV